MGKVLFLQMSVCPHIFFLGGVPLSFPRGYPIRGQEREVPQFQVRMGISHLRSRWGGGVTALFPRCTYCCFVIEIKATQSHSVGSRISQRVRQPLKGAPTHYLVFVCQKMHENEGVRHPTNDTEAIQLFERWTVGIRLTLVGGPFDNKVN